MTSILLKKRITIASIWSAVPVLFWLFFFMGIYFLFQAPIKNIVNISKFENLYYEIKVNADGPKYISVTNRPSVWVPLNELPKKAVAAFIVSEDGKFFYHHGYDIEQIQKVMALKFIAKKKKVRGASTITQQLVKNLFLTKEKSMTRKVQEFFYANYIEDMASKNKILEAYLNIIEYGKNIYGIENASQYYFKKSARKLSAKEGAYLAMLLPSPIKYGRSFKQKSLTPFASGIINSILQKLVMGGYIGQEEYLIQTNTPLSFETKTNFPIIDSTESEETPPEDDEIL